jgi:hypothetical protein
MMRRLGLPIATFLAVWIPASLYNAWDFARRVRFTGPGSDSWSPFIDAWSNTAFGWLPIAFFAAVTVFVTREWWSERRQRRSE